MNASDFPAFFKAIWGFDPFPWQTMLATRATEGSWPRVISLPTAAGKTACLDIAVFALALEGNKPLEERHAPRRIWFAVDRRIVVDEAFERAEKVADALRDPTSFLRARETKKESSNRITSFEFQSAVKLLNEVAARLKSVSGTDRPLATARLRGGVLRDDGWARLPSQPAIITSTVDQLGSRLLFRAYGPGDCVAPIHAALAANDSLILLDEAHCAVPFAQTLAAIERFRSPLWCEKHLPLPFSFSILSATPPEELSDNVFPAGAEKAAAMSHQKLQRRATVAKPAELLEAKPPKGSKSKPLHIGAAKHEDSLVLAAAEQACVFCKDSAATRTAVMVNRVATAAAVFNVLREAIGTGDGRLADIVLLTGRMRPLDRDALVAKWSPFLRANAPETPARPILLVTTQCLEVGADFSFDALVTECASLDALRQRFGRLNRLGVHDSAPAVIFARAGDVKPDAQDPIYGTALTRTWVWLNGNAATTEGQPLIVDFGIASLDRLLVEHAPDQTNGGTASLMAPTEDAPILLPAHLDMLCQTSPRPNPEPEVSLFLHGKKPAQPHAFVVWRSDFCEEIKNWQKTLALLPPSPGEMLQAPLFRIRRWLAEQAPEHTEPDGDLESSAALADENVTQPAAKSTFLLWRGRRKQPLLSTNPADIRRGDIIVVPAAFSPHGLGQHVPPDGEATGGVGVHRADLAEHAWRSRHRQAVLRVTPPVLAPWQSWQPVADLLALADDITATRLEIHAALDDLRAQMDDLACPLPKWLKEIVTDLKAPRSERHPTTGLILFGPKTNWITEDTFFGDEDDESADTENGTTLSAHTADVLHYGREFASRCIPETLLEPVLTALRLHDIGKLDPRVQLMLHGGDEIARDSAPEPLAKSARGSTKKSRKECGLPDEFRHEMLSLQIAERCGWLPDDEKSATLSAHLISSHHGYGRPWAPIAPDPLPSAISLYDGVAIPPAERLAWTPAHHIASGIGDRFWLLTRRFGWWGLPMLEAVVRLADWYASRCPRKAAPESRPALAAPTQKRPSHHTHEIPLTGLDPSNPVGWLATLGTFRLASSAWPNNHLKLGWYPASGGFRPVLVSERPLDLDADVVPMLNRQVLDLRVMFSAKLDRSRNAVSPVGKKGEKKWQDTLKYPLAAYLHFCRMAIEPRYVRRKRAGTKNNHFQTPPRWEFAASWASEMNPKENTDPEVILAKRTFFDFTSGQQGFVEKLRTLRSRLCLEDIRSTLLGPWNYRSDAEAMRWDPVDEKRQYALQAIDPSNGKNPAISVIAANALAVEALPLFPAIPTFRGHQAGVPDSKDYYAWCLWEKYLGLDAVKTLLHAAAIGIDPDLRGPFGVTQTFRSTRVKSGKDYYCFTPSKVI